MNDQDISKLAAKLTESLVAKEDINRLENEIKKLDKKADTILEFAQAVDEEVDNHEKRLTKVEDHIGLSTSKN